MALLFPSLNRGGWRGTSREGFFLLLLLACALTGCGGGGVTGSTPSALPSGIQGLAQITTGTGTPIVGQPPATPQPYPGAVVSIQPAGGGTEIARATADTQGQFKLTLSPGTYLLVPVVSSTGASAAITATSQTVTVSAYQFANIVVNYQDNSAV